VAQVVYGQTFSGGVVHIPPSKSAAHRQVLCAALSQGKCTLSHVDMSEDIKATVAAVTALGVQAQYDEQTATLTLDATGLGSRNAVIDCGESGSTLRFLIPIAAALGASARFWGHGRLPQRPLGIYADLLPSHGVEFRTQGGLPLEISGRLKSGVYRLPGDVSSQFVTGLLFALPLLPEDSEIILLSPLESKGYVDLTLSILKEYGVAAQETAQGYHIPGGQRYTPKNSQVEGDWSQAAFFLCMAALSPTGAPVEIQGLKPQSLQGDKACVELFQRFGLDISWQGENLVARNLHAGAPFGGLRGFEIDASQIPDMVPALAVCGAFSQGETRIVNAQRLRLKESDRLAAMSDAINGLGGKAEATPDGMVIWGQPQVKGGLLQGKNDHRVVMALAAAAFRCQEPLTVTDAQSIRKSYPGFFRDFIKLGGIAHVLDLG